MMCFNNKQQNDTEIYNYLMTVSNNYDDYTFELQFVGLFFQCFEKCSNEKAWMEN